MDVEILRFMISFAISETKKFIDFVFVMYYLSIGSCFFKKSFVLHTQNVVKPQSTPVNTKTASV